MMETSDARIKGLLKRALSPADPELKRDLWPQMLQRLDEHAPGKTVPWIDWVLLVLSLISIAVFPHSILVLLYHL